MKPIAILRMRQEPPAGGGGAIIFVGSKTFSHNQVSAQSCSLTDLLDEAGASATLAENDVVFINLCATSANVNMTQEALTPTDYTPAHTDLYANDSADVNQLVSYRVMGASPDTTVSIPASTATAQSVTVSIMALRGVDTATPLDATPTTASDVNGATADPAAITPATAGAVILVCPVAATTDGTAFTNPGDLSAVANHYKSAIHTGAAGTKASAAIGIKTDWVSGAFNPAAQGGGSVNVNASWSAVTLAIRPA